MPNWSGRYSQHLTALVLQEYGTICHLCGQPGADTADHIVPRSHGGDDSLGNLRPAHGSPCNYSRGNMTLAEWFTKHPPPRAGPRAQPSRAWL